MLLRPPPFPPIPRRTALGHPVAQLIDPHRTTRPRRMGLGQALVPGRYSRPAINRRSLLTARRVSTSSRLQYPCFRAFHRLLALPSAVLGPVLPSHGLFFRAASRSASSPSGENLVDWVILRLS